LDWKSLIHGLPLPADQVATDNPPVTADDISGQAMFTLDPTKPADAAPQSVELQLSEALDLLVPFLKANTPGVPGVEGAQDVPQLQIATFTVQTDTVYPIPGNDHRTSLSLYNDGPGVVYIVPAGALDTSTGMPIPVDSEREVKTTGILRLLAKDQAATVRTMEEAS